MRLAGTPPTTLAARVRYNVVDYLEPTGKATKRALGLNVERQIRRDHAHPARRKPPIAGKRLGHGPAQPGPGQARPQERFRGHHAGLPARRRRSTAPAQRRAAMIGDTAAIMRARRAGPQNSRARRRPVTTTLGVHAGVVYADAAKPDPAQLVYCQRRACPRPLRDQCRPGRRVRLPARIWPGRGAGSNARLQRRRSITACR